MTVSTNGAWNSMSTRTGLLAIGALTVVLYIAAAATGFDNVLAVLWIVPAVLFLIGIVAAWRARRQATETE